MAEKNTSLKSKSLLWFFFKFINFHSTESEIISILPLWESLITSPWALHLLRSSPKKVFQVYSILQHLPKSKKFHLKRISGSCHFLSTMEFMHLEGIEYRRVCVEFCLFQLTFEIWGIRKINIFFNIFLKENV